MIDAVYAAGSAGTPSDGYKTRNFRPDPTPAPAIPRQRDARHDTREASKR